MRYWDRIDNSNCMLSSSILFFSLSPSLSPLIPPVPSISPTHFPSFLSSAPFSHFYQSHLILHFPILLPTLNSHPTRLFFPFRWTPGSGYLHFRFIVPHPPSPSHSSLTKLNFLVFFFLTSIILSIPFFYLRLYRSHFRLYYLFHSSLGSFRSRPESLHTSLLRGGWGGETSTSG